MLKIQFILLLFSVGVYAQTDSTLTDSIRSAKILNDSIVKVDSIKPGKAEFYNTNQLNKLVTIHKRINKENCPKLVQGYRVQIFSFAGTEGIQKSNKYYNQFLMAYPNIPAYKQWDPPSHKVRVGDCRTYFEAEEIKNKIKADFPYAFIVPDYITSPYAIDCEDMEDEEAQ